MELPRKSVLADFGQLFRCKDELLYISYSSTISLFANFDKRNV